ncbi:replication initiation protein [Halovibrio sp. HP20-50]|uniref:replication initiation protein n=1 Tax=Halovibrio sp. HP20-59 TaxID=3080275 RepID=UPI00294B8602|nr:replication initiation protein [Halovibrio sp. HP20-59]MEA2120559.1 replication initiation protein [Halovibrio sp. HP20-59]
MRAHVEREDIVAQLAPDCQGFPPTNLPLFGKRLPRKPYHTDDFGTGLRIRDVQKALQARYIQPNGPTHRYWLVYDVDRSGAVLDWYDRGAPPPTIVAQNPANGHAHLIYGLEVPVRTAPDGKPGPLRYAAAIDCALRAVLDADVGYAGLICKNPLHSHWRVTEWEPRLYELGDLASWLDLSSFNDRRKRLPDYGLGRNCTLFEKLRTWAYRAIRQGWPEYERWHEAVLTRARAYNDFEALLPDSEVRATAKSVAKWTHQRFTPSEFSAVQAQRGSRKGAKRRDELLPIVTAMIAQGASQAEVARKLKISRQTLSRWVIKFSDEATS